MAKARKPPDGIDLDLDQIFAEESGQQDAGQTGQDAPAEASGGPTKIAAEAAAAEVRAGDEQINKLREERDALFDRLARQQAEFDNFRKRSAREQQEFRDFALADAIRMLLPVLDSFDRALDTSGGEAGDIRAGLELIRKQLGDVLAKLGVRAIEAKGQTFDPRLHEAIDVVQTSEAPDNTVIDTMQTGYTLHDRLLRPAVVRVARNPAG